MSRQALPLAMPLSLLTVASFSVASISLHAAPVADSDELLVEPQTLEIEPLQLELSIPAFDEFETIDDSLLGKPFIRGWHGKRGESEVDVLVLDYPSEDAVMVEPEDVTDRLRFAYRKDPEANTRLVETKLLDGKFGSAPYAHLLRFDVYDGTDAVGELFCLGGLYDGGGYAVEVRCNPTLEGEAREEFLEFLTEGVEYQGKERDHEWSEEEVEARMERDFTPQMLEERLRAFRTKHYIVLGNASGAKAFGKKLEEYYKLIQKTFGFPEQKGRRLMPVFLWRTRDDYLDFTVKTTNWERQKAAATAGFAYKDYYTTTYDSPESPTHIHELTHQLMKNRLRMVGGGSWFHEGAAVYLEAVYSNSENANMFTEGRRQPKAGPGERIDFKTLMSTQTLAFGENGSAGQAYNTAGTITWFVNKDKRTKDKFLEYMFAMSETDRVGDFEGIETALRKIYDIDLETFEQWYLEFWKRPKK